MAGTDEVVDRGDTFAPTVDDTSDKLPADTLGTKLEDELLAAQDKDAPKDAPKADDTEPEAEPQRDEKGRFIPKARFDEAVTKERERRETAERQLADLQRQMQTVSRAADTSALEAQLVELRKQDRRAMMDGDEDKSIALSAQIDRINRQIIIQESQSLSSQAGEEAREGIRVEMAIEKLEATYPVLREGAPEFDQGLVDLVLAAQSQLISRERMAPSQALIKATNDIMARFQPAAKADDKPAGGLASAKGADRTQAAKAKNVDAALRTPPDTRDVGIDTDKAGMKDGTPLPQNVDDLKAIPLATLKRMRGDLA